MPMAHHSSFVASKKSGKSRKPLLLLQHLAFSFNAKRVVALMDAAHDMVNLRDRSTGSRFQATVFFTRQRQAKEK